MTAAPLYFDATPGRPGNSSWVVQGDCLAVLRDMPSASVHCVVTSPPYWALRDYSDARQIGLEATPGAYIEALVEVFRHVRRVLRKDGTCWINLGDTYVRVGGVGSSGKHARVAATRAEVQGHTKKAPPGFKDKDLVGIPWRVALALQADGWWLRCDVVWDKPNGMPFSGSDRPTRVHEYVFLMTKSKRYAYDAGAVAEKAVTEASRNKRAVWSIPVNSARGLRHKAVMPEALVEPCIAAGCPPGGTVLDPFFGSGTVGCVAQRMGRRFIGIELHPPYVGESLARIAAAR